MVDFARTYPSIPHTADLTDSALLVLQHGQMRTAEQQTLFDEIVPRIAYFEETHTAESFTDGGSTSGTKTMSGTIPAGAIILGTKVIVLGAFGGDVSAALEIGDGDDDARYMTPVVSVFTQALTGVQTGVPSGDLLHLAAVQPVLTVTTGTDFTLVLESGGALRVAIYYIATA